MLIQLFNAIKYSSLFVSFTRSKNNKRIYKLLYSKLL
jgi:hypothetical protein